MSTQSDDIFEEGGLEKDSVVKDYLTTQQKNEWEINSVIKEYLTTQKVII